MNCFIKNTSYGDFFLAADNVRKLDEIRPSNMAGPNQRFNAESMYKSQYNSKHHQEETFG